MNWGRIDSEFEGFGWKRLSPHELLRRVSNGHEFQGVGALKSLLGAEDLKGDAVYYWIGDDPDGNPEIRHAVSGSATWYDSRRKKPNRNAEWRLYYSKEANEIERRSSPGDLMIVGLRRTKKLAIMLVDQGSSAEAFLSNLLGHKFATGNESGRLEILPAKSDDIGMSASEIINQLGLSFADIADGHLQPPLPTPLPEFSRDEASRSVADWLISERPDGLGPCTEVVGVVVDRCAIDLETTSQEPDATIVRWLEVAEASYREWERFHLTNFVERFRYDSSIPADAFAQRVSGKWSSLRQGRVSRAGTMFELFLYKVFKACGLQFAYQVKVESGKLPDFLFPGKDEYLDPTFPEDRLRILGAKNTLKDRWRQILAEADRVTVKHGATRDVAITPTMFRQMRDQNFVVVMPNPILGKYTSCPENLISLGDFIRELHAVQKI